MLNRLPKSGGKLPYINRSAHLTHKATTDPLDKLPEILKRNPEKNLCVCNEVPKITIINAIVSGATTVDQVKARTFATMGSACCKQQVERLIECLTAPEQ